jgi:hypothetical protein
LRAWVFFLNDCDLGGGGRLGEIVGVGTLDNVLAPEVEAMVLTTMRTEEGAEMTVPYVVSYAGDGAGDLSETRNTH